MKDRARRSVLAACTALVVCTAAAGAADDPPPSLPSLGGAWVSQGPAHATGGQVEGTFGGAPSMPTKPVTGAVQAIVAHPTDANTLWIGAVGGGIWKTTNATAASPTWTPQTDTAASLAIGAMDRDPTDATHNTLVAGIGQFTSFGVANGARSGILRTTNGGTNWTLLGGTTLGGRNISGVAPRGATIVVSVNVADAFTCNNIGIWRSVDTGATFTRISASNGAVTGLPLGAAFDLASDPTNNAVLYTAVRFTPVCNAANANGVYKSTDTGATWTRVSDATMNTASTDANVSNIRIAVGQSGEVYAGIINNFGQLGGLFRSGNGGTSWTQLDTPQTNENGSIIGTHPSVKPGGQGSIHFSIRADPTNANVVYVGGDRQPGNGDGNASFPNSLGAFDYSGRLFRVNASLALGSQATALTHNTTSSNSAPHADSRRMVFNAAGDLLESDDGGIYRRTNPLGTGDWFSVIGDLRVTEMHDVAYDRVSNMIISGNQDTGTTEQRTVGTTVWTSVTTGDGGDVAVDDIGSLTQSRRYTSFQNLQAFRQSIVNAAGATTMASFPARTVIGGGPFFVAQFVTPVEVNTIDPTRLLLAGDNDLYESFDRGSTITALGLNFTCIGMAYGGTASATPNAAVLYALREGSSVVYVRTAGSGAPVATATNPGTGFPLDIALDPTDWQKAYVVTSANEVWSTVNAGATWTNVTGNLPNGTAELRTIAFVPGSPSLIVVGGRPCVSPCVPGGPAYRMAVNASGVWNQLGTGLPNTIVWDMDYDPADDVLVVGTLGRGAWRLDSVGGTLPTLSIDDVTVSEGNAGTVNATFTVTLSASANASASVATANNTAVSTSDYSAVSSTVTFTAGGPTTQTVVVQVNGDVLDEANETFFVNLTSPSGASLLDGQGLGTITDDDTTTVSIGNTSVTEGLSGTNSATFTVTLSTPSALTVTVPYSTANDTATAGSDYVAASSSLTFLTGETSQPLVVTVNGDATIEPDETFFVNLGAPTNASIADGQGVGTILNDDPSSPSVIADFVMLGQPRTTTVSNVDTTRWFKARLVPGRSYAASVWAPSTDPSESAVTLALTWFRDDGTTAPTDTSVTVLEPVPETTGHTGAGASIIPTSAECVVATGCTYRLRLQATGATAVVPTTLTVVETTMVSPYWQVVTAASYDAAPQIRNNTSSPVTLTFTAFGNNGSPVCSNTFAVPANGMMTFGISGGAPGCSIALGFGSAQIAHHGPPGSLTANITTFSSLSGLSFDAPFRPRNSWTALR